jgi:hypothetical protein
MRSRKAQRQHLPADQSIAVDLGLRSIAAAAPIAASGPAARWMPSSPPDFLAAVDEHVLLEASDTPPLRKRSASAIGKSGGTTACVIERSTRGTHTSRSISPRDRPDPISRRALGGPSRRSISGASRRSARPGARW